MQSSDSIAKDAMLGEKAVSEENYAGRGPAKQEEKEGKMLEGYDEDEIREQEKENFIQEELYIHAKVSLAVFVI